MPNPLNGNLVNLYVDESQTDVPDWRMVACLTDTSFNGNGDTIDASSKCGQAKLAGQSNDSVDFEGFFELTPTSAQVSYSALIEIYKAKTLRHWKISTADGVDYYREFDGVLNPYTESLPYNDAASFTGTIDISGDIITEAA